MERGGNERHIKDRNGSWGSPGLFLEISFCQSQDKETKGHQHQRVVTMVLLWKYYSAKKGRMNCGNSSEFLMENCLVGVTRSLPIESLLSLREFHPFHHLCIKTHGDLSPSCSFFFPLPCARGRKITQKLIREDGDRRAMMSTIKWRLFSLQWGGLIAVSEAKAKWTAGEDESASCTH